MIRIVLFLIIGYLLYRGVRSLIPQRPAVNEDQADAVTDLRACSGCGTFIERAQLDDALRCNSCRNGDGGH